MLIHLTSSQLIRLRHYYLVLHCDVGNAIAERIRTMVVHRQLAKIHRDILYVY